MGSAAFMEIALSRKGLARRIGPMDVHRLRAATQELRSHVADDLTVPDDFCLAMPDQPASSGAGPQLCGSAQEMEPGILVPSHRGVDSTRLLLSVDGQHPSLLLKTIQPDQRRFIDAAASFDAQRKAACLNCAPEVLAIDARRATCIMEYRNGWATARVSDLKNLDVLNDVIGVKRKIHGGPRFTIPVSPFDRIRALKQECDRAVAQAPADLPVLFEQVLRFERMIAASGVDSVPSHADGMASNILIAPDGRIELVDFDGAGNVDPYFEIGILINEVFEDEKDFLPALEMFEGTPRPGSLRRARLYAIADDLAWGLWGLVMDATSQRKDVEFYRYGFWRFIRCRAALGSVDFGSYARMV
ncbi:phosphotransferase [Mesorhizobium sp. M7A.F.Ca.US.001.01.1.1]|uniref:phosphotransferase n=1 Tax=unclassified Mesorhizobium TaxID=325217 RepID=UPI0007EDB62C|nr:phosphotransferase [Mesorhizobium sp. WSM1497]ARP65697.1 hypothetical protein A9K65_021875 [Mesorhizobium sp. WSM1497]RVA53295.1 phosphotransferase [Mesorhizobium sp. M7A.F.Ca.US.001.01.1.1]